MPPDESILHGLYKAAYYVGRDGLLSFVTEVSWEPDFHDVGESTHVLGTVPKISDLRNLYQAQKNELKLAPYFDYISIVYIYIVTISIIYIYSCMIFMECPSSLTAVWYSRNFHGLPLVPESSTCLAMQACTSRQAKLGIWQAVTWGFP